MRPPLAPKPLETSLHIAQSFFVARTQTLPPILTICFGLTENLAFSYIELIP